ncbi:MAG TPA: hypothetical protein VIK45_17265, partial [Candidatus Dormibacteraeota bacterium]
LPAGYRSSTGQVNLNLVAWAGGNQGETNMSVQLGSPAGTGVAATRTATVSKAAPVQIKVNRPLSAAVAPASRAIQQPDRPVCRYYWIYLSDYFVWTQAGESLPWQYWTNAGMDITTSQSLSLGVAFSGSGGWGTFSASGSYNVGSGVTINFGGSNALQEYDLQTRYGRYAEKWSCSTYIYGYRVSPMYDTGGTQRVGVWHNYWYYCVPEAGNTRWQRNWWNGYDFNVGGGVKAYGAIGINLSVDTAWSGNYDEWYSFTYASQLCGSNDYPSRASRIEEG